MNNSGMDDIQPTINLHTNFVHLERLKTGGNGKCGHFVFYLIRPFERICDIQVNYHIHFDRPSLLLDCRTCFIIQPLERAGKVGPKGIK